MASYLLERIGTTLISVLVVAVMAFCFMHLIPGNPATVMLGPAADAQQIEQLTRALGLDQPLFAQFTKWFGQVIQGNLGESIFFYKPVLTVIAERAETSLLLSFFAILIVLCIGIPVGIISAVKPNSWIDQLSMGGSLLGAAIPSFWIGLNLILLFSATLRWLPSSGFPSVIATQDFSNLKYLILPSIALGIPNAALLTRITRSSMLDVLFKAYISTARAKGLSEFAVNVKHALRNASIPIVTTIGFTFATLMSAAVVTETVFALPGIGSLVIQSLLRRDYPVIQGVLIVVSLAYIIINFVTDLLYGFLDPRIGHK